MKTPAIGKNSNAIRFTVAAAVLAGAGLSGCAGDPYFGSPGYSQGYNQPVYSSQPRYSTQTYGPSGYAPAYDPYYQSPTYYYPSRQPAYIR